MVYRNNDPIKPNSNQAHSVVAMIATVFFVIMTIVLFSAMFSDINIWWKTAIAFMCIYILYGIGSMIKKALIGKNYCTSCGRLFDD